jgi:hypothetical protein
MTVRIDTARERSETVVSVSGRLEGSGVHELMRECHSIEGELVLDLAGVRSATPEGINAIRELVSGSATLRGMSPFMRLLLADQPPGVVD